MKRFILSMVLITFCPGAFAEVFQAEVFRQSVKISGDSQNYPSCRLYRKRLEQVLQREDEAARAHLASGGKLSLKDLNSVLEIHRRANIPLEIGEDNILWTVQFRLGTPAMGLNKPAIRVQLISDYLNWDSHPDVFPEHFQVHLNESGDMLSVHYRMSYMEACAGNVGFRISVSDDSGTEIRGAIQPGSNLL